MRDVNELDCERADGHDVFGLSVRRLEDHSSSIVLFETALDQRQRERRAVNRNLELGEEKRHRADVIFMAVGQDQRPDVVRGFP